MQYSYYSNSIYEGRFSFVDAKLAILLDWIFERSCLSLGFTGFFLVFDSWSLSIVDTETESRCFAAVDVSAMGVVGCFSFL